LDFQEVLPGKNQKKIMESTAFPESQDVMLYYKQIGKRLSSGNEFLSNILYKLFSANL